MYFNENAEAMTLSEYNKKLKKLRKLALTELLEGIQDDEILSVKNCYRDDNYLYDNIIRYEVFKNPKNMLAWIKKESEYIEDVGIKYWDNPLHYPIHISGTSLSNKVDGCMWWEVNRYKLVTGEYCNYMSYTFSAESTVLGYCFHKWIDKHSGLSEKQRRLFEREYLLTNPHNVKLPYHTGDILKVNAMPFIKPFYVVYGGDVVQGEDEKMAQPYYSYNCLCFNEELQGLELIDLAEDDLNYLVGCNTKVGDCQKVESCSNFLLRKTSKILKDNPDLWNEWMDIYNRNENELLYNELVCMYNGGGLEKYIFED